LLDTMRNSNLGKLLWRLLKKLLEILLVFELFWDVAFIKIFCIMHVWAIPTQPCVVVSNFKSCIKVIWVW
jgi:hypothetical protein